MKVGDVVYVKLNGGRLESGEVIAIHEDIARISGSAEQELCKVSGRAPLGVGFKVTDVFASIEAYEAKNA